MMQDKKSFNFPLLLIIIFFAGINLLINLFVSIVFYNSLDEKNLSVDALIVPNVTDTKNIFETIPVNNQTYTSNQTEFIKKYLIEYIVTRYTVVPSSYIMNKNMELNNLSSDIAVRSGILKQASVLSQRQDGSTIWADAYFNFINGKDGELKEIQDLMKENTSRSVKIISEPKLENDWWVTKVEFIYKSPSTYSLSSAKKEIYEIRMDISAPQRTRSIIQASNYNNASSIFIIVVNFLKKTKL